MNTKMKILSLALIGAMGYASVASAVCPTDPAQPNGAWASKSITTATLAIGVNPGMGLNTSACRLEVALNLNSTLIAKAFVTDTTPANETRYRARFYVDLAEITGLTSPLRGAKIFNASATSGPANVSGEMVAVQLTGNSGAPAVIFTIGDTTQGSSFRQVTVALPSSGSNRIEFDLPQSANATFRYWVNAASAASTGDANPTGSVTGINNTAWSGVKQASLGLFAANNTWRSNYGVSNHVYLDEFDSRRQTYIGQ